METERIYLPDIKLEWSDWVRWDDLWVGVEKGVITLPFGRPGVYEAKCQDAEDRLTIGKARRDLGGAIESGLVDGATNHGLRIRWNVRTSEIVVRWAVTECPAAAEESLLKRHDRKFGALPPY